MEENDPVTCPECGEHYDSYLDLDVLGACNDNMFCTACHCEFDPSTGIIHKCDKNALDAAHDRERGAVCLGVADRGEG